MSYITHVLQPGETIRYQGSVRWILYLQALLLALVGAGRELIRASLGMGRIGNLLFTGADPRAARVVYPLDERDCSHRPSRDLCARLHSAHMDKIESVDVDQTVLGRILDYGDVTIRGTGTTLEPIREVDRPIAFRNEVTAR